MPNPSSFRRLPLAPACCAIFVALLALSLLVALWSAADAHDQFQTGPTAAPAYRTYLPDVFQQAGLPLPHLPNRAYLPVVHYSTIVCPLQSDREWGQMWPRESFIGGAASSPDLNLTVRGWYRVNEGLSYSRYSYPGGSPPDSQHPVRLSNVVPGGIAPSFISTFQVNDWDWLGCNCARPRNPSPYPVTMLGLRTTPGQPLRIASRDIPVDPFGFNAMVLYADEHQLALKYTWEDRVDTGYLVHLKNLCVDPNLVALYNRLDGEGRHNLPAVYNDSIVGIASGEEVEVVVRDSGSFLDPRSWQDWWSDQPAPTVWAPRTSRR